MSDVRTLLFVFALSMAAGGCASADGPTSPATRKPIVANLNCWGSVVYGCPGDPTGGASPGIFLPYTYATCAPGGVPVGDSDWDGVIDDCETMLATTFEPRLRFHDGEPAKGREPYWAVRRSNTPGRISLIHLLNYHEDVGFLMGGYSHLGDSEFIVLELGIVGQTTNKWQVVSATLSAHWGSVFDRTGTYAWYDLDYPSYNYPDFGVTPIIYVAWGKHANYQRTAVCNSTTGLQYRDYCSSGFSYEPLGVVASGNVGSLHHPLQDCVPSRLGRPGLECFWTQPSFAGWSQWPHPSGVSAGNINALWAFGF